MSRKLRAVRLRDDDLAILIDACRDWGASLLDAARMGDGSYDPGTRRTALRYLAASKRADEALWRARGYPPDPPPVPYETVSLADLSAQHDGK